MRCPHVPVHRGERAHGDARARGLDVEDRGRPAVLLPAARDHAGGRDEHDRERVLQEGVPEPADGVRGRGAEADPGEPCAGRHGRLGRQGEGTVALLEIRDLRAKVGEKEILKGVSLTVTAGEVHAIMGPNGSGKSTLANVIAGRPTYEPTGGQVLYDGKDLLAMKPENRAREGVFLAFQYPVEIPGVGNAYFLKSAVNAIRRYRNEPELDAMEFMDLVNDRMKLLGFDEAFLSRSLNDGFSGGEKKRNEIFQMAVLEPRLAVLDETDSGLDIDPLEVVASGVTGLRNPG